jgi:ParB family chromosome partitioning protein
MTTEKKLGKGLTALLGELKNKDQNENISNLEKDSVQLINLNQIIAGVYQPRKNFNQDEINDLANSIAEKGVIQPIIVRKSDENQYEIIAGERRFRAAKIAKLTKIPAIIRKINNHEALEIAIIENIQRTDLNLIEEAEGYKRLIDDFSYNQEEIGKKVGKSRSHIANLLRLLNLPKKIQNFLQEDLISMGHARAIINSENPEEIANLIIKESLNVRETEELVRASKISEKEFNEKLQNIAIVRKFGNSLEETTFVNKKYLSELENKLSELLNLKTKIEFNPAKKIGKILIQISNIEDINQIIKKF